MSITTTTTLPAPVQESFNYRLLSVPVPNMIHSIPAVKKESPRNGGKKVRMRRYNPLPVSLVPLGPSGVTPPSTNLTAVDIDAEMSFYGQYILLNEQVTLQNQCPVLNEACVRLGVSMRQTEDVLIRDMLASSAASVNCIYGNNGDVPTDVTRADFDDAVRTLIGANAYTIMNSIEGADKYGSAPVRDAFFAMCTTDLVGQLDRVDGFISKAQYPFQSDVLPSEWGSIGNIRFLTSSIGSTSPNASSKGNTVYNIFVTGMEAYAVIEQDGYSASFVYLGPEFSGPLALNASVGWKMATVPRLLNDEWILNVRATEKVS